MKHNYSGILYLIFLSLYTGLVKAQCNFTTAVPYYESFESISVNNQLPACWLASNPSVTCLTYTTVLNQNRLPRTGSKYASFYYAPAGVSYFYSNGILLNAGSTYSVSVWYTTEYYGYNNWTDLSVSIGYSQTPTSQTIVASTGSPVISNIYKSLSNTFTVPVTGIYYAAIRANNNGASYAEYLSFDDLLIEKYCSVSLGVTASATSMCAGQPITFTASGADTYTWSNGSTGPVATYTAALSNTISVIGTQTASGCQSATIISLPVGPTPVLSVYNPSLSICAGASITLHAFGGSSYTWGPTQVSGQTLVVSPSVTTTYTLIGINAYGCLGTQIITVTVSPLPAVSASTSVGTNSACSGEQITLTGLGASTFTWISQVGTLSGNPITVNLNATTGFTVQGTSDKGCKGADAFDIHISDCVGLPDLGSRGNGLTVYPNPFDNEFKVQYTDAMAKSIEITDVSGRVIFFLHDNGPTSFIRLGDVSKGIYFLKASSDNSLEIIKIVKQ